MMVPDWAGYCRFRDQLAIALNPTFWPLEHLDSLVLSGKGKVWVGEQAAIIAEVRDYPGGARVIHGLIAAGDVAEIRNSLIPKAEAFGRSVGCSFADIESRAGWARALKSSGYEVHQVMVRKAL